MPSMSCDSQSGCTLDVPKVGGALCMVGSLSCHKGSEVSHVVGMGIHNLLHALANLLQLQVILGLSVTQSHLSLHNTSHVTVM